MCNFSQKKKNTSWNNFFEIIIDTTLSSTPGIHVTTNIQKLHHLLAFTSGLWNNHCIIDMKDVHII